MNSINLKIKLLRAGITQAGIARNIGVTRAFVNQVINGQRNNKRVRMAIAKAVGKRVKDLWPSRPLKKAA